MRACGLTGFIAHVEPAGIVPLSTQVPGMESRVPFFHCRACAVRTNSSGVFMKQASVRFCLALQRRYW